MTQTIEDSSTALRREMHVNSGLYEVIRACTKYHAIRLPHWSVLRLISHCVPHAAADYGRDWSTASGVTPSHMQEVLGGKDK